MEMSDKLLSVTDIQEHLGIGRDRTYSLIKLKSFPKIKIGNTYHIPEKQYLVWLETQIKNKANITL